MNLPLQKSTLSHLGAIIAGTALMLVSGTSISQAEIVYKFDSLSTGALSTSTTPTDSGNQDGWYLDNATASSVWYVAPGTGAYSSSKVVQPNGVSVGSRAFKIFTNPFFTSSTTTASFGYTVQLGGTASGASLTLGGNGTASALNGNVAKNDFGPRISTTSVNGTGWTFSLNPVTSGGGYGTAVTQTVSGLTLGDYYSIRLSIDFTANSGNGAGTLYYQDVTTGGAWTLLTSIQNINLGLTNSAAGYTYDKWNQVWLTGGSNSGGSYSPVAEFSIVPEPGAASLAAGGGVFLLGFYRRAQRIRCA